MPFDRHLIANYKTGLQTDVRQWRLMDDAFHLIKNAYVWRGRVRKRFGSFYMVPSGSPLQSRLRISIGTTNGSGNLSVTVPGVIFAVGQLFSVGTEILTVQSLGTPTTLATTGTSTVHTFNTTTGAFVINGAAATTSVYY